MGPLELETAEDAYRYGAYDHASGMVVQGIVSPDRIAESAPLQHWPGHTQFQAPLPSSTLLSPRILARVNHGRWLADCPFCASAQVTSPADKRFFCTECGNAGQHGWLIVDWPDEPDSIEEALLVRMPANQNWDPEQTVIDLHDENEANGVSSTISSDLETIVRSFGSTPEKEAAIRSLADAVAVRDEAADGGEDVAVLEKNSVLPSTSPEVKR